MVSNEGKNEKKARRGGLTGVVSSLSGDKTIRVTVSRLVKDPLYGKRIRRRTNLAVHDEKNVAKLGDTVEVIPSRAMSKTKSWRLLRVISQSDAV